MARPLTATTYLVLERQTRWPYEVRVVAQRKSKPTVGPKQVAVKLELRIPVQAFDDVIKAVADVPKEGLLPPTVEVNVQVEEDEDDEGDE